MAVALLSGRRKSFPTFVDDSALGQTTFFISGGKIGLQVELKPEDLKALIGCDFVSLVD
jgi:Cys-tRNA(Pro)/Cys-tRNA(Cys) deacylase